MTTGLATGLPYRFTVSAHNLNGESTPSSAATIYACLLPSGVNPPAKEATSKTSVTISWVEPEANGCPITVFTILRNTGANDAMTVSVDPLIVGNLASLREYTVPSLTSTGSTYNIKVRAHNNAGYTDSAPLVVVLAAVPDTPTVAPTSDADITNKTLIKIDYTALTTAQNGGSDVLSYDL